MEVLLISDFEKQIYNTYLSTYKKAQGKPFTYRKKFDDIDESTAFLLKKLAIFFNNYKAVKLADFFQAPYKIYNEQFFDLSFYISPKATKAYTLYQKKIQTENPDNSEILEFTANSLKFIKNFCNSKNINVKDYLNYADGSTPFYMKHLQEHNVNFYSLFGYNDFHKRFKSIGYELSRFMLGDITDSVDTMYNNFVKSTKNKVLVREGLKKIVD
jgi:hypothetical protein